MRVEPISFVAVERRREAVAEAVDAAQVDAAVAHVLLEVARARARAAAVGDHFDDAVSDVAEAGGFAIELLRIYFLKVFERHDAFAAVARKVVFYFAVCERRSALADVLRHEGKVGRDRRRRQREAPP